MPMVLGGLGLIDLYTTIRHVPSILPDDGHFQPSAGLLTV